MNTRGTLIKLAGGLLLAALVSGASRQVLAQGTWSATGSMANVHTNNQTATLLYNGRVLVVGGLGADETTVATAELYHPTTEGWSATGSMGTARSGHTATRLLNGKVLVTGGFNQQPCSSNCAPPIFLTAEIYDPTTGMWSATGSMNAARAGHTATLLYSGKVLAVGGFNETGTTSTAELYNPQTGNWSPAGNISTERSNFTAVRLYNGDVLIAGGYDSTGNALATTELYDFPSGTWDVVGSMNNARGFHTATQLFYGHVLVAGGINVPFPLPTGFPALASAELYNPLTGTWSMTGSMSTPRTTSTLTPLYNGRVLAAGGENMDLNVLSSAELYNPFTGTWSPTGSLLVPRATHTATRLLSGKVLVAGGFFIGNPLETAELYAP
ncbi:MAG: hypothetical protein ND866_12225 [Pyrinomonadaceae bacterium]|nr:hypothetical protein [Pyrinomonadaceae bacterium]